MPDRTKLMADINNMANYLNQVSSWYNFGNDPFGDIEDAIEESYIYEFYCYIRYVKELSIVGNKLQFNHSGKKGSSFPKSPAEKDGWAKFEITDKEGTVLFDVCAGVKIHTSIPNYTCAADISIQSPVVTPNTTDVFLIVDAKCKDDPKKKIPLSQLREFKAVLDDLGFPKKLPSGIILTGTSFDIPTIVTNGKKNVRHDPYAVANGFKQEECFYP